MKSVSMGALILLGLTALQPLAGETAHAGDRELELIVVNMTPDEESGGTSTACVDAMKSTFKKDYAVVKKLGETKTRKATGVPKGGEHFLRWKAEQFESLKNDHPRHGYSDAVILIDCRPDQDMLDVLVVPSGNRTMSVSLRAKQNKLLLQAVTKRILSQAWDAFSP